MRAFWAIELPDEVRERLTNVQQALRAKLPRGAVRWTHPDKLHLTVKFLGEAAMDPATLVSALEWLGTPGPMQLEVIGLGSFGGRRPSVVWAGLGGPGFEALRMLRVGLEKSMTPLGFPRERRPFAPHITLGRAGKGRGRGLRARALQDAFDAVAFEPCPFTVTEVVLLESSFGSGGPVRYTPRARWPFGTPRR